MNKYFWLFATAFLSYNVASAQTSDSSKVAESESIFSQFSCVVKNANSVRVQWKSTYTGQGDYFIVERSDDELHFETVSALKISDTMSDYELVDNSSLNGSFFYRIKYVNKSGQTVFSKTLPVSISADVDFRFYPNPADKFLIIRTGHNIDVEIRDASGVIRLAKQLQPGLQIINVSTLEKGIYILKIADKESNRVISEQLVKN